MRRADWCDRMWQTIKAAEDRPFFFGACVQLAAECIDAMTDTQWAASVSDLYRSERRARALIKRSGGLTPLVTERLGEAAGPLTARRGDVVLLDLESGPALGVNVGNKIACAAAPDGVAFLQLYSAVAAWRID